MTCCGHSLTNVFDENIMQMLREITIVSTRMITNQRAFLVVLKEYPWHTCKPLAIELTSLGHIHVRDDQSVVLRLNRRHS